MIIIQKKHCSNAATLMKFSLLIGKGEGPEGGGKQDKVYGVEKVHGSPLNFVSVDIFA